MFAYDKMAISIVLLHGASDLDQRCLQTCNSEDGCTFPPNIFAPISPKSPKTPFWVPFNTKPFIHRAVRTSHVNGAPKLKLYKQVLGVCQNYSPRGVRGGGAGPLNVNLGLPIISETTIARKFNLKIP